METNFKGLNVIELNRVRSGKYYDNVERYGETCNTCFLCGKPTAQNLYIHFTTDGYIVPGSISELEITTYGLESQGCFAIGSECAKKVGKTFTLTIL